MKRLLWGITLSVLLAGSANAALLSRAGGQAYYDDVLNITWLADANLADTNAFGVTGINADGTMTWTTANEWIAAMNAANYLGKSDWTLPSWSDLGLTGCQWSYGGTDCGYNPILASSQMAHLFYSTLGNVGYYDTNAAATGCSGFDPWQPGVGHCLTNDSPFTNLLPRSYWNAQTSPDNASVIMHFDFFYGKTDVEVINSHFYAWAVRPGDIAEAPVPAAVWLFGGALGVLGIVKRRQKSA